ncbi:TPA: hypothetical protein ACH3X2_002536 [Trebouxia sp. C0005]
MLTPSKTSENNWQLMRAQSKLKKPLHAPTRNRQDRNSAPAKKHGLPNRFQTSSCGARKVPSTISNRESISKMVKQDLQPSTTKRKRFA